MSERAQERVVGDVVPGGVLETVTSVVQALAAQGPVEYVEAVLTLPASIGAAVDPADVDVVRAEIAQTCRSAGGERAACILLVNPAEIPMTLSLLALLREGGAASRETSDLEATVDDAVQRLPFTRRSAVAVRSVDGSEVATLVDESAPCRRVDVALVGTDEESRS